jgi:EmrB/QacA subfamily drug resistance transporter
MEHMTTRNSRLAILITCVPMFMVFLDATVVNVAFSNIEASFRNVTLAGLSWVLSAYSIGFAALLVPFGRVADLYGARRMFASGLAVFVGASAVCALAPSVPVLIAARAVQGAGAAAVTPAAQALLMAAVPHERRTAAIGILAAVGGIAAAAGPPLGALLVEADSWRLVFLLNIPVGLATLLMSRLLPVSPRRVEPFPDIVGSGLVVVGVGALALGLVQGSWWGWGDARVISAFAIGVVLTPLFLARCARHRAPVVPLPLFRSRAFSVGNAGTFVLGISVYALLLGNAIFLTQVWRWSVLHAGLALTPTPVAAAIVAPIAGMIADRRDPRVLLATGALAVSAGAVWLATQVTLEPKFLADWVPGAVLVGIGLGMSYSTYAGVAVSELHAESFGLGSGVSAMTRQLGAVLGVALLVAVLGHPSGGAVMAAFDSAWLMVAVFGLIAVVPCLLWRAPGTVSLAVEQ